MRLIRTHAVRRRTIAIVRQARTRSDDAIVLAGLGSITYGIGQLAEPAAWMFAGVALIAAVALGGSGKRRG